jgi:hypothetical protein
MTIGKSKTTAPVVIGSRNIEPLRMLHSKGKSGIIEVVQIFSRCIRATELVEYSSGVGSHTDDPTLPEHRLGQPELDGQHNQPDQLESQLGRYVYAAIVALRDRAMDDNRKFLHRPIHNSRDCQPAVVLSSCGPH